MTHEEYLKMSYLERVENADLGVETSPLSKDEKKAIYDYLKKCGAEDFYKRVFIEGDEDDFLRFARAGELMSPCAIHQYLCSD